MIGLVALASVVVLAGTATRDGVDEEGFRNRIVTAHNVEREAVGSPAIEWSDDLAASAKVWADELARNVRRDSDFDHDPGNETEGENLWMGTRGHYSLDDMLFAWSSEKRLLERLRSWEEDIERVGHYTQMVWKDTARVGCAVSRSRADEFLVCRYGEPGNYKGESPYVAGGMSTPAS